MYDKARQELICKESRLAYPVRDGIPVMLESEARKLADDE
ncbi:MAG TPA: Trm112 family protein [Candidatus Competibacteraceae bacterium]|nr:Trm112 family protein [Candidatus Competibacteraceae bacterium]